MTPSPNQGIQSRPPLRLGRAIGLAAFAGIPAGVFLKLSAAPFGPILLGWLAVLGCTVFVTMILGLLARQSPVTIGFSFAAGVAATVTIANAMVDGGQIEWWQPFATFGVIFAIVGVVSLFSSLLVAMCRHSDQYQRSKDPRRPS